MYLLGRLDSGRFSPASSWVLRSRIRACLAATSRGSPPFSIEAAGRTIAEALRLAREGQLLRFIGPWLLSTFAMCASDPAARRAALDEGVELLDRGCVGHNYYHFYAHAIDASADLGDLEALAHWADALEAYTRPEPNPWADFHIARGRALALALKGNRDAEAAAALRSVRADAEALGFRSALGRLDTAIAVHRSPSC